MKQSVILPGPERRGVFLSYFKEKELWELLEVNREDINFGRIDLFKLKEGVESQIEKEKEYQFKNQLEKKSNFYEKVLPAYRLEEEVPKWLPRILAVKSLPKVPQDLAENLKAQIDANLLNFFRVQEFSKVVGIEQEGEDVKIYFEYHKFSLEEDIVNRKEQNRQYDEYLLWNMLYSLVSMASKLREDNQTLADIRPSRIYYNSYQLSAVPYGIFPDQDISLVEKVKDREQQVFFAPEQQKEFQSGQQEIVDGDEFFEKNFKQESFQIGLTILYAATLNEDNPCYDYDKIAFLPQEVGNLLGQFRDNYYQSERKERLLMYTLEVLLLDPNPKTRKLPSEIYSILKGFEKNIKFMSGLDEFKQKLEEQFNQNFTSYKAYVNRA